MLYREVQPDQFEAWNPAEPIDGVRHPSNIEILWPPQDLAALDLYAPADPGIPKGKREVSRSVQRIEGVVQFVYELDDIVLTVDEQHPPLEPWQFWSIIDLSGIGEQALRDAIDLIDDVPFKVKATQKLAHPPGGRFLRSDPLFNNPFLMMQLEKTEEEINALWLQAAALE